MSKGHQEEWIGVGWGGAESVNRELSPIDTGCFWYSCLAHEGRAGGEKARAEGIVCYLSVLFVFPTWKFNAISVASVIAHSLKLCNLTAL